MKQPGKLRALFIAILGLAVVGVAAYPPAHATYVRRLAARHLAAADVTRQQMTSPVAQALIKDAADALMLTMKAQAATVDEIRERDRTLTSLISQLRNSPPPDMPVYLVVSPDPTAVAGHPLHVRITAHTELTQAFLARVTARLSVGDWQSPPFVRTLNQPIDQTPVDVDAVFEIPTGVAGSGTIRAGAIYRLNPTGEGRDLDAAQKGQPIMFAVVAK